MSKTAIRNVCCTALLFAAYFFFASTASAQMLYGTLTGNVTDTSGASVPAASIKARNLSPGIDRKTKSNGDGVYFCNDLNPGTYADPV